MYIFRQSIKRQNKFIARSFSASPPNHKSDNHSPPESTTEKDLHPEEYLKVGRNWPNEYYHPSNYATSNLNRIPPPSEFAEENPTGQNPPPEDFSSPFWTKAVLGLVIGAIIYRVNEYYANDYDEHPLRTYMNKVQLKRELAYGHNRRMFDEAQRLADDKLILQEASRLKPEIHRFAFSDGFFERASDHLIEPGSQIDISNIKIKKSYEKDDDLFGPPFPKKKEEKK